MKVLGEGRYESWSWVVLAFKLVAELKTINRS